MAVHLAPPGSVATGIGSLPHTDPVKACDEVIRIYPQLPYAPTLPNRGLLENIVFCDSERLPGRVIREGRLLVDRGAELSAEMEQIYLDYIEGNYAPYEVSAEYASGFHEFIKRPFHSPFALKCQVTGPVTFGMQVVDAEKRPVYYDSQYADVLSKLIALRARWLEQSLQGISGVTNTLVVVNEPYLAALGSSVVPIDMDTVRSGWHDIADLLGGSIGIHCCSNTDWNFIFSLDPGVVSFDAYATTKEFLLYRDDLFTYLEHGGVVAWGIVPADNRIFSQETPGSLYERYMGIRKEVTSYIPEKLFDAQSIITPSCGIRFATEPESYTIMDTAAMISARVRGKPGL
ncbi:MAG: hypothetical protein MUF37_06105 [Methanoregulaceae archaeon]|jgi:hypothetical protein|nr:hypothetical protein [Methanoregulaceae archaeon]